jgi:hypothetical protein
MLRQAWITHRDLRANPNVLYVFGDNHARSGRGGQAAEMRGEPNAVGVRTKRLPANGAGAYLTDADEVEARAWWVEDLARLRAQHHAGGLVVLPLDGIGTGRAELADRAPKLAEILEYELGRVFAPED